MKYAILKKVSPQFFLLLQILLLLSAAPKSKIEKCLIDHPNQTQACMHKNVTHLTLNSCYSSLQEIKSKHIQETIKDFCFYQVSEFPNLESCLIKSKLFFIAENHDAATLNCYLQFQENIKKPTCQKIANSLRLPDKQTFLKNHCENL